VTGNGNVLADHQRLLRATFDAQGEQVIDTQGDSFFVVFARAKDALAAAIAGSRTSTGRSASSRCERHGCGSGFQPCGRMRRCRPRGRAQPSPAGGGL
jgi:class 3 adenylate cyclase